MRPVRPGRSPLGIAAFNAQVDRRRALVVPVLVVLRQHLGLRRQGLVCIGIRAGRRRPWLLVLHVRQRRQLHAVLQPARRRGAALLSVCARRGPERRCGWAPVRRHAHAPAGGGDDGVDQRAQRWAWLRGVDLRAVFDAVPHLQLHLPHLPCGGVGDNGARGVGGALRRRCVRCRRRDGARLPRRRRRRAGARRQRLGPALLHGQRTAGAARGQWRAAAPLLDAHSQRLVRCSRAAPLPGSRHVFGRAALRGVGRPLLHWLGGVHAEARARANAPRDAKLQRGATAVGFVRRPDRPGAARPEPHGGTRHPGGCARARAACRGRGEGDAPAALLEAARRRRQRRARVPWDLVAGCAVERGRGRGGGRRALRGGRPLRRAGRVVRLRGRRQPDGAGGDDGHGTQASHGSHAPPTACTVGPAEATCARLGLALLPMSARGCPRGPPPCARCLERAHCVCVRHRPVHGRAARLDLRRAASRLHGRATRGGAAPARRRLHPLGHRAGARAPAPQPYP